MYLSDNELASSINDGTLICDPKPKKIDANSFDVHLGDIKEAKIWDIHKFLKHEENAGRCDPELRIGRYNLKNFAGTYLTDPPQYREGDRSDLVVRRDADIIVRPCGYLLWQTREDIGTPFPANYVCFINGKSGKARTGIVVHCTAPTIHAGWHAVVVLEIANLGPFDVVLREGDSIAQVMVAKITSPPSKDVRLDSTTFGQTGVDGAAD